MIHHPRKSDPRLASAVRPTIESLEQRQMLSVASNPIVADSATLRNGTLVVVGTDRADQIRLSLNALTNLSVDVTINSRVETFARSDIKNIRVYGLGGSDNIQMLEVVGTLDIGVWILGGNGNDTLAGASSNDTLVGAKGDDVILGYGGNDFIDGSIGNDRIIAGEGRDTIRGGLGADTINSGAGRDVILDRNRGDVIDSGVALSLDPQKKQRMAAPIEYVRSGRKGRPAVFFSSVTGLTPQQVRTAYELGDLSNPAFKNRGKGQTIAIVSAFHYPTAMADLNTFSRQFGLPEVNSKSFKVIYASGNQPSVNALWAGESALDVQWAHAIAPAARILLVEADTSSTDDLNNAISKAVKALQPTGGVVSMSFGGNESFIDTTFTDIFRNIDTDNVSFVSSAGDIGGLISTPAADAEVLSVGGTFLSVDADGNRTAPEAAWVDGGGGTSTVFDRPGYQDHLVIDNTFTIGDARVVPDVAWNADPASAVAMFSTTPDDNGNTGWQAVGGTSAGAAQWSGLVALINERRIRNGFEILGNGQLNQYLYGVARKYGNSTFNDITTGSNTLHAATVGFDQATGWGTPQASALIDQMAIANGSNPVSTNIRLPFDWNALFTRDMLQPSQREATYTFAGRGTVRGFLNTANLRFLQTDSSDILLGTMGLLDISADNLTRQGNSIFGRGQGSVLLTDGTPAVFLLAFEGRLFRVNGQDKVTGKFYAISSRGKILGQGAQAILRGTFTSPFDTQ